jgi:hypothetical protein
MEEIKVEIGQEQSINVGDYVFIFKFNPFDREWVFDLQNQAGEYIYYNIVMRPNTYPLNGIDTKYDLPRLCMIDKEPDSKEPLNPLLDFGDRLGLFEITEN